MNLAASDTITQILFNSNIEDIAKYCQTDQRARSICQNNHFWQQKYFKDFDSIPTNPNTNWYQAYRSMYQIQWSLHPLKASVIVLYSNERIFGRPILVYKTDQNAIF